jgi:hypothetical protein
MGCNRSSQWWQLSCGAVALATQVAYATMLTSNSTKANHAGLAETLLPATTEHLFPTTVVSYKLIFQT